MFEDKIAQLQSILQQKSIDGWLIFDFQKRNALAMQFLQIPSTAHLTRRLFYWIPARGTPVKIVHKIEPYFLDKWPGEKLIYFKWQTLQEILGNVLCKATKVAMEYSPFCAIPYVSTIDAGMAELVRSFNVEIVSSSDFIQHFTCLLDPDQLESHLQAAKILDQTAANTWELISSRLKKGENISEYEVQQFIKSEFSDHGCFSEADPICAVNKNSSDPHFAPSKENNVFIRQGDFILIDLWCKKKEARSIYADITRVAVAGSCATSKQNEIFSIVRKAQIAATDAVKAAFDSNKEIRGCDVDRVARRVIEDAGYGEFFTHRTGHNIHLEDHGPGTNLDSIETNDERTLIAGTCFSIEPGIYLPGEFGVRLEYDVYVSPDRKILVTGGVQEQITLLF